MALILRSLRRRAIVTSERIFRLSDKINRIKTSCCEKCIPQICKFVECDEKQVLY